MDRWHVGYVSALPQTAFTMTTRPGHMELLKISGKVHYIILQVTFIKIAIIIAVTIYDFFHKIVQQ